LFIVEALQKPFAHPSVHTHLNAFTGQLLETSDESSHAALFRQGALEHSSISVAQLALE
jgi:hypothetical protein